MRPERLCRLESDTVGRTRQKDRLAHCQRSSHCSADKITASFVRNDVRWVTTREPSAYRLGWKIRGRPNSLHENLIGEDLRFAHPKWGGIYVRNKRPAVVNSFAPDRIAVLQHGGTYGSAAFDVPVGGLSWMDYLAACGFDAYCLDLPSYGRSTRPPQMSEPAEKNPPFMRTLDAAESLGFIYERIRERCDVSRVCLIGHSWGCAITALFSSGHNDLVERLVLFAPGWHRTSGERSPTHVDGELGAYRTVP
tara:strand:- start:1112 stop:1864 length:753 start_codon:yes stop_codon:yes gene_type:complete